MNKGEVVKHILRSQNTEEQSGSFRTVEQNLINFGYRCRLK